MECPDFFLGVKNLLVDKNPDPPQSWNTEPLLQLLENEQLVQQLLNHYVTVEEGSDQQLALDRGTDYTRYPHWWIGLPSESEIEKMITKNAKLPLGAGGMNKDALVQYFVNIRRGKIGVREKVEEVLARKTILGEGGVVEWVHDVNRFG